MFGLIFFLLVHSSAAAVVRGGGRAHENTKFESINLASIPSLRFQTRMSSGNAKSYSTLIASQKTSSIAFLVQVERNLGSM